MLWKVLNSFWRYFSWMFYVILQIWYNYGFFLDKICYMDKLCP
jgi:hypothetical protein